jgi:hypothetical protein
MGVASDSGAVQPNGAPSMGRAIRMVALVGAFGTVLGLVATGLHDGIGIACGAALATVNLWAFARVVSAFLRTAGRSVPWAAVAVVKMLALFALAYALMKRGLAPPIALGLGYLALPVGITLAQLFAPAPVKSNPQNRP